MYGTNFLITPIRWVQRWSLFVFLGLTGCASPDPDSFDVEPGADDFSGKADESLGAIKFTFHVNAENIKTTMERFDLGAHSALTSHLYFFDTKELTLSKGGLFLLAHKVSDGGDYSIVRMEPLVSANVDTETRSTEGFSCGEERWGGQLVESCMLLATQDTGEIDAVTSGEREIDKLFSKEQEAFAATYAQNLDWTEIRAIGPVRSSAWNVKSKHLGRKLRFEQWEFPDETKLLEISARAGTQDADLAQSEVFAYLNDKGVELESNPVSRDLFALDAFSSTFRRWDEAPVVLELDGPTELYALGDIHGDYDRMISLLVAAGLVRYPESPTDAVWLGGSAVLVIHGDLISKWDQGIKVVTFLQALSANAGPLQGRVIVTMGNHEAAFLGDPNGEKTKDFAKEIETAGLDPEAVAGGWHSIGRFLRALPFAVRINGWFFAHAGNSRGASLSEIQTEIQSLVDTRGFGAPEVMTHPLLETDQSKPWWEIDGEYPLDVLQQYTQALGVQRIVQGHEPGEVLFADGTKRKAGEIYQKFGIWFLIDVGMSRGVDYSKGALLHITELANGSWAEVIYKDGRREALEIY